MARGASGSLWRRRPRGRAWRAAALATAAAGIVTGCGTAQDDPAEKAQATVETLLESCAREDAIAVERLLSQPTAERFIAAGSTVEGCRWILALGVPRDLPDPLTRLFFRESRVLRAEANAGFASVIVQTAAGDRRLLLGMQGGVWQVTNPLRGPARS